MLQLPRTVTGWLFKRPKAQLRYKQSSFALSIVKLFVSSGITWPKAQRWRRAISWSNESERKLGEKRRRTTKLLLFFSRSKTNKRYESQRSYVENVSLCFMEVSTSRISSVNEVTWLQIAFEDNQTIWSNGSCAFTDSGKLPKFPR